MHDRVQQLLRDLKVTSGCRFISANRLKRRDRAIALFVAYASVFLIVLTVIQFAYKFPPAILNDLTVATLGMSVLVLAVSLLQYSTEDAVVAEQHHRCGLEVRELRRTLRAQSDTIDEAGVVEMTSKYNHILQKYSINHDDNDFRRYQLEHPDEFPLSPWEVIKTRLRLVMTGKAILLASTIAIGAFFIWFLLFHVLPARID
jgi:hypothetical protein